MKERRHDCDAQSVKNSEEFLRIHASRLRERRPRKREAIGGKDGREKYSSEDENLNGESDDDSKEDSLLSF